MIRFSFGGHIASATLGRCAAMRHHLRMLTVLGGSILLSGCVVTPEGLNNAEVLGSAQERYVESYSGQEPVRGQIDLGEAMARAVLYNLDERVQVAESLLRSRELASANAAMLPALTASASRNIRNKVDASSSYSVSNGTQSLATSTSQDMQISQSNAALAWNVLDLGLSYVRAKQAADQALAAEERRRRVLARLVEDVRTAYWRALAAEHLAVELPKIEARARAALEQSRMLIKDGNASPASALSYQKEIYELQDRVQTIQSEVISAKSQLASLMNLPPGTQFTLVRPKSEVAFKPLPDSKSMVLSALEFRPDVREALYQERITEREKLTSLLETLPSIGGFLNVNATSNSYTLNKEWLGYGAQASWNLMRVFTLPLRQAEGEAREKLAQERARALVSSVALQVAISRERYGQARRRLQTAADYRAVQMELLGQMKASASATRSSDQELVREEMSALLAQARYDMAMADVQGSWAVVQTSMGRDPYPETISEDLGELRSAFRAKLSGRPEPRRAEVAPKPADPLVIFAELPNETNE